MTWLDCMEEMSLNVACVGWAVKLGLQSMEKIVSAFIEKSY